MTRANSAACIWSREPGPAWTVLVRSRWLPLLRAVCWLNGWGGTAGWGGSGDLYGVGGWGGGAGVYGIGGYGGDGGYGGAGGASGGAGGASGGAGGGG